jgi:8-oxo-dGTP pyrophosphatase MutT (NUDIX family)
MVLVKSFGKRGCWGFPKGKINKDEQLQDCAIREVLEEISFDGTSRLRPEEYVEIQDHNWVRQEQSSLLFWRSLLRLSIPRCAVSPLASTSWRMCPKAQTLRAARGARLACVRGCDGAPDALRFERRFAGAAGH